MFLGAALGAVIIAEDAARVGVSTIEHEWFTNGARNANTEAQRGQQTTSALGTDKDQQCVVSQAMLRIERNSDGCVTKLTLMGRIQSNHIAFVRSAINDGCERTILDLGQVTLVDLGVIRFLISCEDSEVVSG